MKLLIIIDYEFGYDLGDIDIDITDVYELDDNEAIEQKLKSLTEPDNYNCSFLYAIYDTNTKELTNYEYDCRE